jgi:hypothetical protein
MGLVGPRLQRMRAKFAPSGEFYFRQGRPLTGGTAYLRQVGRPQSEANSDKTSNGSEGVGQELLHRHISLRVTAD